MESPKKKVGRPSKEKKAVVPRTNEAGQPLLGRAQQIRFQDNPEKDLEIPKRWCVFENMAQDDAVASAHYVTEIEVVSSLNNGSVEGFTPEGRAYADFVNYNIRSMPYGSWFEAVTDMSKCIQWGFSILQHPFENRTYGPYANTWCLKKLSPREPKSIYTWLWDDDYREIEGFVQHPNYYRLSMSSDDYKDKMRTIDFTYQRESEYTVIRKSQYLHFRHRPSGRNPQGDSIYAHCYTAYSEKKLFERLEVLGTTKDLGGCFIGRAPSSLFEQAQTPDIYPTAAVELNNFQQDIAKLQRGETSSLMLLSDTDDKGKFIYDLEIKGVDGGGKQYKTSEIIEQRRKSIYSNFGAEFRLLGQDGNGSNALFNGSDITHSTFCKHIIDEIVDVINTQLIPRILAINGIFPLPKDMPVFVPADNMGISLDEFGKFLQRAKSVNALTPEIYKFLATKVQGGLPLEGIDEIDFSDKGSSRAGESQGTSGTGDTQSGGANSSLNSENKSKDQALPQLLEERGSEKVYLVEDKVVIRHE